MASLVSTTVNGNLDIIEYLRHTGDTNTQIRFESSQITIGTSGGCQMSFNADEKLYFYTGTTSTLALTLDTSQAATFAGSLKAATILDAANSAGTSNQVLTSTGSALDWKTLSEISGVDGSGTASYIPKWTDTDTIGNSIIYDSGASVGISSVAFTSPVGTLHTQAVGTNTTYLDAYSTTNGESAYIYFRKSDNDTAGTLTQTDSGDYLGALSFFGVTTGTPARGLGAAINIIQEGVSGATYVPAYISFATCTASAYGERMRITNDGNVGIGTTSPGSLLTISGNSDDGDNACALAINDEDSTGGSKLPAIMFYGGGTMQGRIRGGDGTFAIAVGSAPTTALSINTGTQAATFSGNISGGGFLTLPNTYGLTWGDLTNRIEGHSTNNTVDIYTNSTLAFSLSAAQAATFSGNLTVQGDTYIYNNKALNILDSGGQRSLMITNYSSGSNSPYFSADPDNQAADTKMYWYIDGAEKMSLDSGGALSGTTATFSGDVKAAQFYTGYDWTTRSGGLNIGSQGLTTGAVSFYDGVLTSSASIYRDSSSVFFVGARGGTNTSGIAIDIDGKVGIGTTAPAADLHIKQGGDFTGSGGAALHIGTSVITNTSDLGLMVSVNDATTTAPQKAGLILYNNNTTAGGWSPMLLFSKKESGTSPYQATMAAIAAKSPLGTGNGGSWIDGELHFYTAGAATTGIVPRMVIDSDGNVGIGTINPGYLLDVNGAARIVDGISSPAFWFRPNDFSVHCWQPKGGWFHNQANVHTGAIRIKLPPMHDAMVTFWVDVFDYADNESFSAYISGYPYLGSTWSYTSAVIISGVARNFTVRFGDNNTAGASAEYYVYIGETSSTWNHPQVVVRDVFCGYHVYANEWDGDDTGWGVSFATSFENVAKTQSNTLPYGDYNKLLNTPTLSFLPLSGGTLTGALTGTTATFVEAGTGNGMGGVTAATASSGGNAGYRFQTGGSGRWQITTIGSSGSESLRFYDINNSVERLRITDGGKVGIGTDTCSSILHVDAEMSLGQDDNNRSMLGYSNSTNRLYIGTRQGGTNYLDTVSITSGKVGIGTATPYRNAHIYQAPDGNNLEGALQTGGTSASLGGYFGYNSTGSGRLSIISLDNAGGSNAKIYLGFGLATDGSPTTKVMTLDQNKLVTFGMGLQVPNNGSYSGLNTSGTNVSLLAVTSSNELMFGSNAVGGAGHPIRFLSKYITFEPAGSIGVPVETMRVTNGTQISVGSVGIGTNAPANLLNVYGGNDITPTSGGAGQFAVTGNGYTTFLAMNATASYFGHNSSARSLVLMTNETARLTISGSGATSLSGALTGTSGTFSAGIIATTISGTTISGNLFSGSGASLTTLNATNISSGTLNASRLATSGATAASYTNANITIDNKGRVTAASNGSGGSTPNNATITIGTGTGITGSASFTLNQLSNQTISLACDLGEFTSMTADITDSDEVILLDSGSQRRKPFGDLKLSKFENDSGWTSNTGDITAVTAGTALSGGGNSGGVTLNVANPFLLGDNTDTYGIIGRAKVGYIGHNDYAGFAHRDVGTTTSYALIQNSAGATFLNAANGQIISFRINNANVIAMDATSLYSVSNGVEDLGKSGNRWNNVYSEAGNFSGTVTGGTFSGSGASLNTLNANELDSGTVPAARLGNVTVATTAADVLSTSNGAISADDAGTDKLVFWDEDATKLKYLTFSLLDPLP